MKKILVMDADNYDTKWEEITRTAVRGIIVSRGRLLLIESANGEVKLPGGGQEEGEDDIQTLIRETMEETGYHVIPESIREFGEAEEKRRSLYEDKIWHQINRYYSCDILEQQEACRYSETEKKQGFHQVWYTLDEAIRKNEARIAAEGEQPWNQREWKILKLLQEYK